MGPGTRKWALVALFAALVILGVMFSFLLLLAALALGVLLGGYVWWKGRALRAARPPQR